MGRRNCIGLRVLSLLAIFILLNAEDTVRYSGLSCLGNCAGMRGADIVTECITLNDYDMADLRCLAPFILKWEGGFVNDPADAGGVTNMGVTISTWRKVGYDKDGDGDVDVDDLKLLTREDVIERVLKPYYWDRWKGDDIRCQSLANILVDWVWGSGDHGIVIPQRILGVKADSVVGPVTLNALNDYANPRELFDRIKQARVDFIEDICRKRPANVRFKKGWMNRLRELEFSE